MADVPVNPASPDPLEAAEAQDSLGVAPAAEPEITTEAELLVEAEILAEPMEALEVQETNPAPAAEEAAAPTPSAASTPPEPVTPAEPEPQPEPAPVAPAPATPAIAATLEAPPLAAGSTGTGPEEGGEWDLLLGKVRTFLDSDALHAWWERLGGPLRAAGLLFALVLVLRLYGALLATVGDLPLLPRLLQLAGLIAVLRFGLTRLVRTEDRQAVLNDWKERWQRFRGSV
ncbi:MAG: CAAD domain-containing protein [Cyanobacteriota bacterium]